jgi:chemotaxis protein methyltransferase CheR
MIPSADGTAVEALRAFAVREFGLRFGEEKQAFLEETLGRLMQEARASSMTEYLGLLSTGDDHRRRLAAALTVPETYFFRGTDQLRAFRDGVLPERIRLRQSLRELRVLSAGCATGEEPYTLAMILSEAVPDVLTWKATVLGVDLNPHLVAHASRARYGLWSMRDTSADARARYFVPDGKEFIVQEQYRRMTSFRAANLSQPPADLFLPGSFDVIFCRNVIMYFTVEVQKRVVEQFARALAPGGYLFLGHAETLRGLSSDFVLHHSHESFYYQKREGATSPPASWEPVVEPSVELPPLPAAPADDAWIHSIRESSERMASLAKEVSAPIPAAALSAKGLSAAVEYLKQERYREALELMGPIVAAAPGDLDAKLLRAVLLCHCGRGSECEDVCREILKVDDLNAEAHHLIAICREQAGDLDRAIEQNEVAQYLDAGFAMPHVHVGRLARRKGDLSLARRQLEQAVELLGREESSRILLFGGGFSREALQQVCRGELAACGGPP